MARGHDASAYAFAFDLLAIDDRDVRSEPLEQRKAALAKLLRKAKPGIRLSEHLTGPGHTIFEHACKLGLEGIVHFFIEFAGAGRGERSASDGGIVKEAKIFFSSSGD